MEGRKEGRKGWVKLKNSLGPIYFFTSLFSIPSFQFISLLSSAGPLFRKIKGKTSKKDLIKHKRNTKKYKEKNPQVLQVLLKAFARFARFLNVASASGK